MGPYKVCGPFKVFATRKQAETMVFDELADAAQEAEFLHAESGGEEFAVQDRDGFFVYRSKGAPK